MRLDEAKIQRRLADEIVVASRIAKTCLTLRGSQLAYSVKARKISRLIEIYPEKVVVVSLEHRSKTLGTLAVIQLPNKFCVHAVLSHLSRNAQMHMRQSIQRWFSNLEAA